MLIINIFFLIIAYCTPIAGSGLYLTSGSYLLYNDYSINYKNITFSLNGETMYDYIVKCNSTSAIYGAYYDLQSVLNFRVCDSWKMIIAKENLTVIFNQCGGQMDVYYDGQIYSACKNHSDYNTIIFIFLMTIITILVLISTPDFAQSLNYYNTQLSIITGFILAILEVWISDSSDNVKFPVSFLGGFSILIAVLSMFDKREKSSINISAYDISVMFLIYAGSSIFKENLFMAIGLMVSGAYLLIDLTSKYSENDPKIKIYFIKILQIISIVISFSSFFLYAN